VRQTLAEMMSLWVPLEQRASAAAAEANPEDECRVYEWRPSGLPELPAIWNWIDDGQYEIVDTSRGDDLIVIRATIGVKPSDLEESMGQLVRLTDVFRAVIDPALWSMNGRPLGGAVRSAKRVVTRSEIEDFDGVPVMCMSMLVRFQLAATI
jgi:hypothetical protein